MKTDTIAAIATAMTNSGIGIVRMSGDEAFEIIQKIYKGKKEKYFQEEKGYTIHYGYIVDGEETIDEVLVMIMRGPHSFTGEDTVEINCHGGVYVMKRILETVIKYGARPAEPGEFTKRAFLNGRMDLSQAEAVMDVINAKNEFALSSSIEQLNGRVSEKIKSLRKKIIYNIAFIESALDDPEHISIDGYSDKLSKILEEVNGELSRLINNFDNGRIVKEGVKTVILGKPNLGEERAIVTDIEGTTRDTLEESINLNGVFLNLIDTAGIRDSEDVVEQIGVNKAKELAEKSDLVIFVADASKELDENDKEIINLIKDKQAIVLLNKSDLGTIINEKNVSEFDNKPVITFSAKTGDGLDELENKIRDLFYEGKVKYNDELYITNARQKESLINAKNSIEEVIKSVENDMPEDFYSIDLMDAYTYLGQIIGESVEDDLVNEIFSKFCMGK